MTDHEITLTGDTVLTDRFLDERRVNVGRLETVLREADATVTHLEAVPRGRETESYPAHRTVGGLHTAPADIGQELSALGIDAATVAGNHTGDHSYAGVFAAQRSLDDAGVAHAGVGWDLTDAREPATVETPAGDVAVVSAAASFHPHLVAGRSERGERRPGLSPLRHRTRLGDDAWARECERVRERGRQGILRNEGELLVRPPGLHVPVDHYVHDEQLRPDERTTDVLPRDERELRGVVERAARRSATVVVSVHAHGYARNGDLLEPPAYLRSFAETVADAGADVVVTQGDHTLRGVDAHDGVPVIHGLGGLFRTRPGPPQPHTDELLIDHADDLEPLNDRVRTVYEASTGIVPTCVADDHGVDSVRLRAVERDEYGVPALADPETARETFATVRERSTDAVSVAVDGGTATVTVD